VEEIGGQRVLLVKNPWCDGTIWKGSGSIAAKKNEEGSLLSGSKYSEETQQQTLSPGSFWIAFSDVLLNFESLYLNWNPGLFRYRQDHHFSWDIQPLTSPACFTRNPQYSIQSVTTGPVWVLLSRHFSTEERKFLHNTASANSITARSPLGFIGLYVFDANGKRVHLSDNPMLRGPFVDSPQCLLRLDMPGTTCYTIVVAQQDLPLSKYSFTLSAYSRELITMDSALSPYLHRKSLSGLWTSRTAGGNANSASYPSNPQYVIKVTSATDITMVLETSQLELPIHVNMVWAAGERVTAVTAKDILGDSGEYRRGCALAKISNVPPGLYTLVCSTFEKGQTGSFTLHVESTTPCDVKPIAGDAAGRFSLQLPPLLLKNGIDRMLAPVIVSRLTRMRAVAQHVEAAGQAKAKSPLKVSLERGQGPHKTILASSCDGEFNDAQAGVRTLDVDIDPRSGGREGVWLVVERFGGASSLEEINVEVLSDALIQIGIWGTGDG
jgi:calpain-7